MISLKMHNYIWEVAVYSCNIWLMPTGETYCLFQTHRGIFYMCKQVVGYYLPSLIAVVKTCGLFFKAAAASQSPCWPPQEFIVTNDAQSVENISYVHIVWVRGAGWLGLLLGLSPHKPVVVLQLLLPLLLFVDFFCASSLQEEKKALKYNHLHMLTQNIKTVSHNRKH